ncbi:MAG: M56 family metallopeptidase [bacterium]|nr:M56 family metallopeptidase [bacterium]
MTLLQFLLIQVNLVILFGLYKWLAAKNGQFNFNRWYLILGPIIAIALPFFAFERSSDITLSVLLPAVEVVNEAQATNAAVIDWSQVGIVAGALVILGIFAYSMWKLVGVKRATYIEDYKGKDVYLLSSEDGTTHSLFNRIYLHPSHADFREIILEHEYAHCKNRHSWDLVLMAFYKALFWYNPAVYKWGKEMQLNHEYLADAHVLSLGVSPKTYGATLLALNFSHSGGNLVHAFNQPSSLRKRIVHFKHQNKFNMKHLLLIPAVAAMAFATTSMVSTNAPKQATNSTIHTPAVVGDEEGTQPTYPGGKEGLMNYLMTNLKYPKELEKQGAEGKVFVKFTVAENGVVKDVNVVKSSGFEALDAEAVRVINNMQNWEPAMKDGKKVAAEMTLPIMFKL